MSLFGNREEGADLFFFFEGADLKRISPTLQGDSLGQGLCTRSRKGETDTSAGPRELGKPGSSEFSVLPPNTSSSGLTPTLAEATCQGCTFSLLGSSAIIMITFWA